jgi:hypothetical protein
LLGALRWQDEELPTVPQDLLLSDCQTCVAIPSPVRTLDMPIPSIPNGRCSCSHRRFASIEFRLGAANTLARDFRVPAGASAAQACRTETLDFGRVACDAERTSRSVIMLPPTSRDAGDSRSE